MITNTNKPWSGSVKATANNEIQDGGGSTAPGRPTGHLRNEVHFAKETTDLDYNI